MAKKKVSKKTVSPAKAVKELEKEAIKIEKEVATTATKDIVPDKEKAIAKELDEFFEDVDAPAKAAPVKEEKKPTKVTEKKELEAKPNKVAKAAPVKSPALIRFESSVQRYRDAVANTKIETGRSQALTSFIALMDFVLASKSREIFDAFYDFFVVNRKGILANTVVLNGIARLDPTKRNRVGAFYTLFFTLARHKVDSKPATIDINAIRVLMNNDAIANYAASMLR